MLIDVLPQILYHSLQIFNSNVARLLVIKQTKHLLQILSRVLTGNSLGHEVQKFIEVELIPIFLEQITDHVVDGLV